MFYVCLHCIWITSEGLNHTFMHCRAFHCLLLHAILSWQVSSAVCCMFQRVWYGIYGIYFTFRTCFLHNASAQTRMCFHKKGELWRAEQMFELSSFLLVWCAYGSSNHEFASCNHWCTHLDLEHGAQYKGCALPKTCSQQSHPSGIDTWNSINNNNIFTYFSEIRLLRQFKMELG